MHQCIVELVLAMADNCTESHHYCDMGEFQRCALHFVFLINAFDFNKSIAWSHLKHIGATAKMLTQPFLLLALKFRVIEYPTI